nr:type II toxin-antitoxin system VapC family toxin [Polymorphobacter sp.]
MADLAYLLDTNICIHMFAASIEPLRARVEQIEVGSLAISAIVFAELAAGIERHDHRRAVEFGRLLQIAELLPFDYDAAQVYGTLPFKRAKFDRLIAAHALSSGLTLVTANTADFSNIPNLKIENWTLP